MNKHLALLTITIFTITSSFSQEDFTKYIDPTIGNVAPFLVPTFPTMHLPNQMMRMYPIKKDYISDQVDAFPFQVTSHRSPGILPMKIATGEVTNASWNKKMTIDHDLEIIHPWFYSTYLIDDDIKVSFTPSEKGAIYKIDFPENSQKNVLIKGSENMVFSKDKNYFNVTEVVSKKTGGTNPVTSSMSVFLYGEILDVNNNPINEYEFTSNKQKITLSGGANAPSTILIKYAVSYVSLEQAKLNFEKELRTQSFDELSKSGKKRWEKTINQIQVEGGTEAEKRTFYTSLYRTYERMVNINEDGKYYSGYDQKVHTSKRSFYVDDWIWDTYRAQHPLRTILDPDMEDDMLNSYTLMYEQSGWMPTFPQVFGNHLCMNSYHSSAIFIDGYRKGLKNYNVEKAYEGIKKNLIAGTFIPWRQGTPRLPIDDIYHKKGYFPSLKIDEKETEPNVDSFEKRQPVAVSLGVTYDFWALAELSKELGKKNDYVFLPQKPKIIKPYGILKNACLCQKTVTAIG